MGFGFSDEDHVRVLLRFIWHQGYVRSAQHHRDSALPEAGCNVVGVRRTRRVESNRNQVRLRIEIDRRHRFIHMEHGPMGRHKGGQVRHCDLLEIQDAGPPHPLDLRGRSGDQKEGSGGGRHVCKLLLNLSLTPCCR